MGNAPREASSLELIRRGGKNRIDYIGDLAAAAPVIAGAGLQAPYVITGHSLRAERRS